MSTGVPDPRPKGADATTRRVRRSSATMARAALNRMEGELPFFAQLPPEHRAELGLVVQAFVASFADWLNRPVSGQEVAASVFASAPRELVRAVSLPQTVELVRSAIDSVEPQIPDLATTAAAEQWLREAMLRYTRELAFAAAHVYASAAEVRGAWDARLEALVVDGLLRGDAGDALLSRTTALGWRASDAVVALAGSAPDGEPEAVLAAIHRLGRELGVDVLAAVHGSDLVTFVGSPDDPASAAAALAPGFGPGPLVVGPVVTGLSGAAGTGRIAVAALRAAPAWPGAPRPVAASDLLAERALAGEPTAREALLEAVYRPLLDAGTDLLVTLSAYVEEAGTIDGAARRLFVHPNTVRYRLRRVAELTGQVPTEARAAFVLRVALVLGRLEPDSSGPDATTQHLSQSDNSPAPDWSLSEATDPPRVRKVEGMTTGVSSRAPARGRR
jgi:hypothetical protein